MTEEVKILDPQTFFNRLQLTSLPEDMKNFIKYLYTSSQQTELLKNELLNAIKKCLTQLEDEKISVFDHDITANKNFDVIIQPRKGKDESVYVEFFLEKPGLDLK